MYLAYNGLVIDSATRHAQNTTRHARARFVPRWCRASRACADAVDAFASLACARASEWLRSCAPLGVDPRSGALGRASSRSSLVAREGDRDARCAPRERHDDDAARCDAAQIATRGARCGFARSPAARSRRR